LIEAHFAFMPNQNELKVKALIGEYLDGSHGILLALRGLSRTDENEAKPPVARGVYRQFWGNLHGIMHTAKLGFRKPLGIMRPKG
jgi:hypothetical protein